MIDPKIPTFCNEKIKAIRHFLLFGIRQNLNMIIFFLILKFFFNEFVYLIIMGLE